MRKRSGVRRGGALDSRRIRDGTFVASADLQAVVFIIPVSRIYGTALIKGEAVEIRE